MITNCVRENNYLDTSSTNPNGIEFDNLYLDLNNIIHPCFHPEDDDDDDAQEFPSPLTFEQVFENMFKYIDRLFNIVRPRKLLYMAIDGVAPRAKMNQQRARRFRTAKDREIAEEEEFRVRRQFEMEGKQVLPKQETELSDSNIITPGTKFMQDLSKALKNYIKLRLSSDLGWRNIKVILSDANVPGEGEHKIMSFIRQQRKLPSYNPNTRHCLYGLDADLIMLALAVHEIHFSILREDVIVQNQQNHFSYKQFPHNNVLNSEEKHGYPIVRLKPYQFLHVWILREYLELDMQISNPPESFKFDIERIVDDFIFMCFFVGNDFLPHIPSLSIHEGAIDLLMTVYKKEMKNIGGYLVDMIRVEDKKGGFIKLSRVEKFILLIFNNTKELKQTVKDNLRRKSDLFKNGDFLIDKVKLGSHGYKERYYKEKFCACNADEIESTRKKVVRHYTEGLIWVLLYYFSDTPSWTWFYPYHYGPFVSDFKGLSQVKAKFVKGSPFKPFDQLLSVLPPRSALALPAAYQTLMNDDSPIIDFYPTDFEIDVEGKRFSWQGVCKLPLIDESRLLCETMKLVKDLGFLKLCCIIQVEESDRNTQKCDQLLVRSTHNLGSHMLSVSTQLNGITGGTCLSSTNPNGIEFDNLYLDLNNIIHPCFHPEDDDDDDEQFPPPKTFEEVFENMFKYIDRIFNIIRPRKLLYMAIDGVAPRAKMNQQRTRRFRNANDIKIAEEELRVKRQFEMDGKEVLPKQETELSDPNIITPGTKFMQDMSNALKNYIKLRLSNDLGWRNIKVILSDSNVPGEGEHKIMSFIRQQRKLPSYNPNTRHCLYGLDADLIMLALAAHEVHFSLLREFLHVWILREYLELDMQISDPPESFKFDIERIVDDFIFMCFFVGNDFLPRTPSLKLPEVSIICSINPFALIKMWYGAIDLLMDVYKKELKNIGGYLVDMVKVEDKEAEFIKLSRVEKFILLVGTYEEKIFKRRSELWEQKLKQVSSQHVNYDSCNASAIVSLETKSCDYFEMLIKNTKEFKQTVKDNLRRKSNLFNNVDSLIDKVKLVCPGYKERYYREKFCAYNADEIEITRINVVRHYTEGLIWVLLYYFSETPSWTWFYPFHYGPFVSDFKGLSQFKPNFVKGIPFKPFDQLLSVLPPRSVHVLPVAYQTLMKDDSPIIDFYTTDFEIDMDGCRFTWQGVCKLPFIDESRLLSETKKLVKDLGLCYLIQVEESERNMHKCDQLLVRSTHKLGSHILLVSTQGNSNIKGTSLSEEIGGILRLSHKYTVMDEEVHTSNEDFVLCADYEPSDCGAHIPRLLDGVKLPEKR
ncbi:hypothetical protein G4B88_003001 [Cannabis sativa]|uniref:Uncharacterized protein n=1 Tax=Cannabis sativa TaxID=3483 RepID=A0A7J6FK43_CANSA|nr:hypothetical protein G4B88_003001 [Cannabis sativa]